MNLTLHLAGCPVVIGGLKFVVFAFVLVRNLNKSTILCPIELRLSNKFGQSLFMVYRLKNKAFKLNFSAKAFVMS